MPTLALPATAPISSSSNQRARRAIVVCLELGVGVERDDHVALRQHHAAVERRRLAAIGQRQHADALLAGESRVHDVAGAVGRAIVDHDDLELDLFARQHAPHRALDHPRLVESGDQHRDEALGIDRRHRLARLLAAGEDGQHRHQHGARDAQRDGHEEQPFERRQQAPPGTGRCRRRRAPPAGLRPKSRASPAPGSARRAATP